MLYYLMFKVTDFGIAYVVTNDCPRAAQSGWKPMKKPVGHLDPADAWQQAADIQRWADPSF